MKNDRPIILHQSTEVRAVETPALNAIGQTILLRLNEIEERLEVVSDERLMGGRTELENLLTLVYALAMQEVNYSTPQREGRPYPDIYGTEQIKAAQARVRQQRPGFFPFSWFQADTVVTLEATTPPSFPGVPVDDAEAERIRGELERAYSQPHDPAKVRIVPGNVTLRDLQQPEDEEALDVA